MHNQFGLDHCLKLRNEISDTICKRYKLHYFEYCDVIEFYVYFNEIRFMSGIGFMGLFKISDLNTEKERMGSKITKNDDMVYPIVIKISPYASQRDLIDFIKNKVVWKHRIIPLQNKFRDKNIKIGKIKKKNRLIRERNQFIFQNQDKTGKEIKCLVYEKFGEDLPYEYIPKIISREKKKRQKP